MIRHVLAMLLMASPALAQDPGLAVWSKIHDVFSHPRCANCHVGPDNVPIWSGFSYGPKARPHGMNINAGTSRRGTESLSPATPVTARTTCHCRMVRLALMGGSWRQSQCNGLASRVPRSAPRSRTRRAMATSSPSRRSLSTSRMMIHWSFGAGTRDSGGSRRPIPRTS
jgi:hypothetical protein